MKKLKTYRDIVQAVLDGYEVEGLTPCGDWQAVTSIDFDIPFLDFIFMGEFRVRPTKPSINWSHVHPDFRYLARVENGLAYLFKDNPHMCEDYRVWHSSSGGCEDASIFSTLKPGNCDWTESLVERPKE